MAIQEINKYNKEIKGGLMKKKKKKKKEID